MILLAFNLQLILNIISTNLKRFKHPLNLNSIELNPIPQFAVFDKLNNFIGREVVKWCVGGLQLFILIAMAFQSERNRQDEQKLVKKIKNYIYDPVQVIGSGFSSNVYKGLNELNGETIAIKVLELSKIQTEVEKYLLNNEINALRALSHPYILRTVQILMTKNNVYIMTEFCENGDLQQHVKRQNRLSQLEALKIIRDVADGYLALEDKKIVHRDLKTANIFLTPNGPRIADFGFCEFLNQTKKPQVFYNVGSPAYMSPQSYRDNQYTPKSDIWSIGIILYEMLVGQTPDKNLSYSDMSGNLMAGRIANVPNEDIKRILAACFKKDAKERCSAAKLLEAVNNEILRLEAPKTITRPQTVQPVQTLAQTPITSTKTMGNMFPVRNQIGNRGNHSNRHMISSMLTNERQGEAIRSQSPFKPHFVSQLGQEHNKYDYSPLKQPISKRFRDQSPLRPSLRDSHVKIKASTELLLFLFRLLNYLGETDLERANFMRLILFRHRSYLESAAERYMSEERMDRTSYQPFKEFQFLKSRFDQAYLQKESQAPSHALPTQILSKLNQLSNQMFTDTASLVTYCGLIIEAAGQCQQLISNYSGDYSKVAVLWDYLMIHGEILELYVQGLSVEKISHEIMALPLMLKEQPKKMGSVHCQLLRVKLHSLQEYYEVWSGVSAERTEGNKFSDIPERQILISNGFF